MDAPEKVKRYAVIELSAHDECVDAGPQGSCGSCHAKMMDAFHHFYGDVDNDRLRTLIATDLYGGT